MNLADLHVGETGAIRSVGGEGALRQHLLDMGVIPGAEAELVKLAPMGDPMEFRIHGYELTLRVADARRVECVRAEGWHAEAQGAAGAADDRDVEHPGLGEGGRYHVRADEHPLPDGTTLTFALAGNQNCGKTTLFNQLTGSNQHVGNFPGVTVDRKSGVIRGHPDTEVTDLPGIYSMSPYSSEEIVSRRFILESRPTGIIDIVDASNIERNLYLTMQLMELDVPMVLALNMMDEVEGNGGHVNVNRMEEMLGIPVVPISAVNDQGVDELVAHALHVARYQERPGRLDFCSPDDHGGAVHRCLHSVLHLIQDHSERAGIPARFAATKVIEGDALVVDALGLDANERETIDHIVRQMEKERGLDRAAAIADMRFAFIRRIVDRCVVRPRESREHERSARIDRVLTGRHTAIPAFAAIMALVFWLTFNVVGGRLQVLTAAGIDMLGTQVATWMAAAGASSWARSLVADGIFAGVGSVLSFLPVIVTLFLFLSLLEDTGYMARIAFVADRPLRRIGLSGRSIVPMLLGFGCTVPAVMATRTLPSERDRRLTVMLTPFMSCSAKMPVYAYLAATFFPGHGALPMVALYALGVLVGIGTALLARATSFRGEAVPFVMELPNYRLPSARNVAQLLWEKSRDFLQKAFSVIFVATIVIWFLQNFDAGLSMVDDAQSSILAGAASAIAPVFAPIGLGDWRVVTALIAGFMAKESIVATLSVLFGGAAGLAGAITPLGAAALLVFCLLYTPCVAAISAIRRELGGRQALGAVAFQCGVAWACALLVRLVGLAVGLG